MTLTVQSKPDHLKSHSSGPELGQALMILLTLLCFISHNNQGACVRCITVQARHNLNGTYISEYIKAWLSLKQVGVCCLSICSNLKWSYWVFSTGVTNRHSNILHTHTRTHACTHTHTHTHTHTNMHICIHT